MFSGKVCDYAASGDEQTLLAIGKRLGISREAVRLRKEKALETLRESPIIAELREFLD